MAYQLIPVLLANAAGLDAERQAFHAALTACDEAEAMARGFLYVPASLPTTIASKAQFQHAMDYNIRLCACYILLLEDTWGPPHANYERDYQLALQCLADPALPLRHVAVFFKTPSPGRPPEPAPPEPAPPEPAMEEFRRKLDADAAPRHFHFADTAEFTAQLRGLLSEWLPPAAAPAEPVPAVSATPARPVTSDDDLFVHDLILRTVSDELGAAAWPEAMRTQLLEIQYKARMRGLSENSPDATQEILLRDGVRVGWAVVARREDEIRLVDIAVAPEHRGKGIASARIGELLAEADRTGKPVRLSVAVTNRALLLYQKLGFRATGGDGVRYYLERPPGG